MGFPGGSDRKESAPSVGDSGLIPCAEDPLEKDMATAKLEEIKNRTTT